MKRLLILVLVLFPALAFGQTLSGVNGDCTVGGQQVLTSGLASSGTQQINTGNVLDGAGVMASFPSCLVTVYFTGGLIKAAIYSNNLLTPTPVSNPITANTDGSYVFFIAPGFCYDIVISTGSGPALPYSRTLTDVCIGTGSGGGGGPGVVGPGTPGHVPKFTSPTTIGDSEGIVTGISPAQWPLGVSLVTGALYFNRGRNVGTGTTANLLAAFDASNLVINAQPTDTNNLKGIARTTGIGGTVDVAYSGTFPCKFDNQTAFGDWVILGSASQCHDAGATQPSGIEDIGRVSSVNAGAGTLANVDLGLPDATNTSAGGGTGVVTPCATPGAFAFYSVVGSIVICDPNVTTDGGGNVQLVSVTTNGPSSGFIGYEQGTAPTLSFANTNYFYADTSVPTSFGTAWPSAPGSVGQAVVVTQVVDPTHIKLGYSSTGCPEGTCIVNNPGLDQVIAQHDLSLTLGGVTAAYLAASGGGNGALFLAGATTGECALTVDDNGAELIPNCPFYLGPPISSFDSNVQDQAYDPANGDTVFSAGIIDTGDGIVTGLQGIGQGKEATGVTGLASAITDSTQAFPTGGFFQSFLRTTANNTPAFPIGLISDATSQPDTGTTSFGAVGLEAQAINQGAGTATTLSAIFVARGASVAGTVLNNYGLDAKQQFTVGTVHNAIIHSVDQGSGPSSYFIYSEGGRVRFDNTPVPASAAAAGTPGEIAWDSGFVYVCVAANTWKRVAIATW